MLSGRDYGRIKGVNDDSVRRGVSGHRPLILSEKRFRDERGKTFPGVP